MRKTDVCKISNPKQNSAPASAVPIRLDPNTLSMQDVAIELGLTALAGQNNQWRGLNSVFVITDNSFSMLNSSVSKESTNALDLVMIVNECSFPEAILWHNERFGGRDDG